MIDKPEMLRRRAEMLRATRRFFDELGFIEVQTPCLSSDNVVDAHIDPVEIAGSALLLPRDQVADRYFLQSSPEFAMKRLLALGVSSIYSLAPVYRAGERSARHNIEFTMLEWYDVGASMDAVIRQTTALVQQLLPFGTPRVVTYRQLFQQTLNFDPIEVPVEQLEEAVADVDSSLANSLMGQRDELLDVLMTERVEPLIGDEMVLIKNYPLSQAALARPSDEDPDTAERFELIVHGLELANGYGELLDADELLRRNEVNQQKRLATGRKPLPLQSRLIDAMRRGMPACSGVALGFDRLVMLALGTRDIADVLIFPIEDA
jgi:elongation factor P--(R)-beta-lysine ligase